MGAVSKSNPVRLIREPGLKKALLGAGRRMLPALSIVHQHFDGIGPFVSEDKHVPAERIFCENLPAHLGQAVNAFTEIGGLNPQKYPHLGCDLDHESFRQKALKISIRSGQGWPFR
jgi:hypothetical protein